MSQCSSAERAWTPSSTKLFSCRSVCGCHHPPHNDGAVQTARPAWRTSFGLDEGDIRCRKGRPDHTETLVTAILIVEDEKRLAASIRRGLEGEGFAVDVALDGAEGKWFAEERDYDAIVLDIMLPELSGYEICEALREAGDWTPILMLTAKDAVDDEVRSFSTGADDFLTKPFSFAVLVARVRALLRRGSVDRPAVLHVGTLSLDPAARRCLRMEEEVELTSREFGVLEFLARQPGDVVSKRAILENVWDFAFEGDPNIVEVYMRRLRRKIDEPFGARSIETVRGAGYRLRSDA